VYVNSSSNGFFITVFFLKDKAKYVAPVEETLKAMLAWGWTVELDSSRSVSKTQMKRKVSKMVKSLVGLLLTLVCCYIVISLSIYLHTTNSMYFINIHRLSMVPGNTSLLAYYFTYFLTYIQPKLQFRVFNKYLVMLLR